MFVQHVGVNGGALCFTAGLLIQFMFLSEVVLKDVEVFSCAEAELVPEAGRPVASRTFWCLVCRDELIVLVQCEM